MSVWPQKSVLGKDDTQWPGQAKAYTLRLDDAWVEDVVIDNAQNGDTLVYDALADKWTNVPSDAKSLRIRSSSMLFKTAADGTVSPDVIMLEALKSNVTGAVVWTCSVPLYAAAVGGVPLADPKEADTVYLRSADMGDLQTLPVTAAIAAETVSDSTLIIAVADGSSALVAALYNPVHGLPTSLDVVTYTGSGTKIVVAQGSKYLKITDCQAVGVGITPGVPSNLGADEITIADHSAMTASNATVTYTLTVQLSDIVSTTVKAVQSLFKSLQGGRGIDPVIATLTSNSHVIPTNADGSAGTYAGASTTIAVYEGNNDVTGLWDCAVTKTNVACQELPTSKTQTVTDLWDYGGYIDFVMTRQGYSSVSRRFTISRAPKGSDGVPTTSHWIRRSTSVIVLNNARTAYTPDTITFFGQVKVGDSALEYYAGIFEIATTTDGTNYTVRYTSAAPETSKVYTPPLNIYAVRSRLYNPGRTEMYDEELTMVVADGVPGNPGAPGTRGSVIRYVTGNTWKDGTAGTVATDTAFGSLPNGYAVEGDTVTISNGTNYVMTKVYKSNVWTAPGTVIDGNLIVTNSITATKINSNGLDIRDTAGAIRIGLTTEGNIDLDGDIKLGGSNIIRGTDDSYVSLNGGSTSSLAGARGGSAFLYGDKHAYKGRTSIYSGIELNGTYSTIQMGSSADPNYSNRIQLTPSSGGGGTVLVSGDLEVYGGTLRLPSQSQRFVLAAPNASAGPPAFRQLMLSDLVDAGNAEGFSVVPSALMFTRGSDGAVAAPVSIRFSTKLSNVSGTVKWTTSPAVNLYTASTGGSLVNPLVAIASSSSVYLRAGDVGANTDVAVTATLTGTATISDSVTVFTVREGSDGITTILGNPAHFLPVNDAGVISYTGSGTTITVYEGATRCAITAVGSVGSGITAAGPVYSADPLTAVIGNHYNLVEGFTSATVKYTITFTGADGTSRTTEATQSLVKSTQGAKGTRGSVHIYLQVETPAWSDSVASAAVPDGTPIDGDAVTMSQGEVWAMVKVRKTGAWIEPGTLIDGKLIVTNSITTSQIKAAAITAGQIDTDAVTADKIKAGEITATKIATGAITATKIAAKTITAGNIAAGTVTADEIATGAITADKISAGAITADKIATDAITADKIKAGEVTATKIAAGTITASRIASKTITAGNIAAGTITATEIAAGSITADRINTYGLTIKDVSNVDRVRLDGSGNVILKGDMYIDGGEIFATNTTALTIHSGGTATSKISLYTAAAGGGVALATSNSLGYNSALILEPGAVHLAAGNSGTLLLDGNLINKQAEPALTAASATLTTANLMTRIVIAAPSTSANLTLPTGTLMDTNITSMSAGTAIEWSLINTGTANAVLLAGTGHTTVGNMTIAAGVSAMFRSRMTAANTFITYRVA